MVMMMGVVGVNTLKWRGGDCRGVTCRVIHNVVNICPCLDLLSQDMGPIVKKKIIKMCLLMGSGRGDGFCTPAYTTGAEVEKALKPKCCELILAVVSCVGCGLGEEILAQHMKVAMGAVIIQHGIAIHHVHGDGIDVMVEDMELLRGDELLAHLNRDLLQASGGRLNCMMRSRREALHRDQHIPVLIGVEMASF